MYKYWLLFLVFTGLSIALQAQNPDTSLIVKSGNGVSINPEKTNSLDSNYFSPQLKKKKVKAYHPDTAHSPRSAAIRSLIIPGWGQVYNHQYLYVPVIYGGLTALVAISRWNNKYYKEFLQLSLYKRNGVVPRPGAPYYKEYYDYSVPTNPGIYNAKDAYLRDRDLCYLGVVGLWGVNVIQAYVAAKFQHSYSIDDKMTIKAGPAFINQPLFAENTLGDYIPGIKITFAIK